MSSKPDTALTSRQRLARGLTYSAVGPVDVTRGVAGLGIGTAYGAVNAVRRHYREGRLAREISAAQAVLTDEFAAAQDVVAGLPEALREARHANGGSRRPWLIAAAVAGTAAVLAGGVAAITVLRRSAQDQDLSPRPPSVDPRSVP